MDISQWPLGRIMQLPDYCFGRRFMVSAHLRASAQTTVWDIAEPALPELMVVWEFYVSPWQAEISTGIVRIALGDQLPTTIAMMDALEPLFSGFGVQGAEPRNYTQKAGDGFFLSRLKMPVRTSGRRLVVEYTNSHQAATGQQSLAIVVSGVPKDIPCLNSV